MRHFSFLDSAADAALFHRAPEPFGPGTDRVTLAMALGATLYCPGTRAELAAAVRRQAACGVTSMVLDLEDAVPDGQVTSAEQGIVTALRTLAADPAPTPLLFVRVRDAEQVQRIADGVGAGAAVLSGFVLPKFSEDTGAEQLAAVVRVSEQLGTRMFAMPVLESPEVLYTEVRTAALLGIRRLLDKYVDTVLAVRVGATDMCGVYGLRRDRDLTVWDIAVVRTALADIVNICARGDDFVVTGPVWEYFASPARLFISALRQTPFADARDPHAGQLRDELVRTDLDRLIREVVLDKANGLIGKTVIHPSHVPAVHALMVVTHEEYDDACAILDGDEGGVQASRYANKMNELRPHRRWARKVQRRASVYGVLREGCTFVDVLGMHS